MKKVKLNTPLTKDKIMNLRSGQEVELTGTIYTARDRAHKRLVELIIAKKALPIDIENSVVYYCGPNFKGATVGACGPTTSSRMDEYVGPLLNAGLGAMIGKGKRDKSITFYCKQYGAVYFLAYSGCGAYYKQFVKKSSLIAFKDLGPEAIYKFEIENFPLVVGIDSNGDDIHSKL